MDKNKNQNMQAKPDDLDTRNQMQSNTQPTGSDQTQPQGNAADQANGYGGIGIEEVDMLLMEDEDALDVDNSMYMDATDSADGIEVDFYADSDLDSATASNVDAEDYASALDTVDMFVAEYDAMPNTDQADSDFAQAQDAGVSWAGDDPLANSAEAQADEDCGCSF